MQKLKKLVLLALALVIALGAGGLYLRYSGSGTSVVLAQGEEPKGLTLLRTAGLTAADYQSAAANVFNDAFRGGFVPAPGQSLGAGQTTDSFFDIWVGNITNIVNTLNRDIVRGVGAQPIDTAALGVAVELHDLLRDAMDSVVEAARAPAPTRPPGAVVPSGGVEAAGITVKPGFQLFVVDEVAMLRCPNWFWGIREPQVETLKDVIPRSAAMVVVQKTRGLKLFRVWRMFPRIWGPVAATNPFVWGIMWLPAEHIKTITITPNAIPGRETTRTVTEDVIVEKEIGDFGLFFRKDP